MRRLGITPLTGAEKQKRHRERVKARLAEAEKLKLGLANSSAAPYLLARCATVLEELGANADERAALLREFDDFDLEIAALLRTRAEEALGRLRSKRRRRSSSLLARLTPIKPAGAE